jgi:hypothetical protein
MKIIIDPKTGQMRTDNDPEAEDPAKKLARTRRELRDMLSGNTPFHEDNFTQAKEEEAEIRGIDFSVDFSIGG